MKLPLLTAILTLMTLNFATASASQFVITEGFTPVFGDPDIALTLQTTGTDANGAPQLWRDSADGWNPDAGIQFTALPNTTFKIVSQPRDHVLEVECMSCDYTHESGLFIAPQNYSLIDSLELLPRTMLQSKPLPNAQIITESVQLQATQNIAYGWGGNAPDGTQLNIHTAMGTLSQYGVDCSGLLYLATDGATPRNTGDILNYGHPVRIEGRTAAQIASTLKPLDIIVWRGHMMLVMPDNTVVESRWRAEGVSGVNTRDLLETLQTTMAERTAVDSYADTNTSKPFAVRRFVGIEQ